MPKKEVRAVARNKMNYIDLCHGEFGRNVA